MTMIQLTSGRRIAVAFCASIATVYSYFCAMANGIVAGALIGLPSRVADVVAAQRHAGYWLYVAVGFQLLMITVPVGSARTFRRLPCPSDSVPPWHFRLAMCVGDGASGDYRLFANSGAASPTPSLSHFRSKRGGHRSMSVMAC